MAAKRSIAWRVSSCAGRARSPLACRRSPEPECRKDAMPHDNDVFTIMRTTRAMRRLKPDPVPDELIRAILEAGTCAASGANQQTWRFLVVKDREVKRGVQQYYAR